MKARLAMLSGGRPWRRPGWLRSPMRVRLAWLPLCIVTALAGYLLVLGLALGSLQASGDDGLRVQPLPASPEAGALLIAAVLHGSPGERAGLRPGDWIMAINRRAVDASWEPGLLRAGEQETLRIRRLNASTGPPVEEITLTLQSPLSLPAVVAEVAGLVVVGVLFLAVATFVLVARPGEPAARLLFLGSASLAISQAGAITGYGSVLDWTETIEPWGFRLAMAAALHLFLLFPTPHPALRRLQRLFPGRFQFAGPGMLYAVPLGLGLVVSLGPPGLRPWWHGFLAFWMALSLVALVDNYRRLETDTARAQSRLILWALLAGVLGFALWAVIGLLPRIVMLAATAGFPLAIGLSILRYHLFDIDLLIRRTLVYSAVTGTLAVIYLASVAILQGLFVALSGQRSEAAVVASTLAIAALFSPLRRRIQQDIDRRFYRRRYDSAKALEACARTLQEEVDLDVLIISVITVIEETLEPAHTSLWLKKAGPG